MNVMNVAAKAHEEEEKVYICAGCGSEDIDRYDHISLNGDGKAYSSHFYCNDCNDEDTHAAVLGCKCGCGGDEDF